MIISRLTQNIVAGMFALAAASPALAADMPDTGVVETG